MSRAEFRREQREKKKDNKTYTLTARELEQLEHRIKVTSAEIVVSNNESARQGKPCYNIKYKEPGQEEYTIGYSSYKLQYVLEWLDTYFEIIGE